MSKKDKIYYNEHEEEASRTDRAWRKKQIRSKRQRDRSLLDRVVKGQIDLEELEELDEF